MAIIGRGRVIGAYVALTLLVVGCASPPQAVTRSLESGAAPAPAAPKRMTAAVASDFSTLSFERGGLGTRPGLREVEELVHAGLSIRDSRGFLQPRLAEAVPTAENGLWRLFPDGRMETTWRIRAGARWHDGAPVTAEDLVFSARVGQDREVPQLRNTALDLVERVHAPDAQTLVVTWKQPFIEADLLFGNTSGAQSLPMPRHLLEPTYLENKAAVPDLPYWSAGFIGAGPFKVREWLLGSYLVLEADPGFMFGRPKIDVIEIKFFGDQNALYAAVLAGVIDLPVGPRSMSAEQAAQLQESWKDGVVEFGPAAPAGIWPQLHNPNPASRLGAGPAASIASSSSAAQKRASRRRGTWGRA